MRSFALEVIGSLFTGKNVLNYSYSPVREGFSFVSLGCVHLQTRTGFVVHRCPTDSLFTNQSLVVVGILREGGEWKQSVCEKVE